jgi:FAD/FMN-containing dehydrogenase
MEFAVPFAAGPDCFMEIRALMQTQFPDVVWPIEYRTLGADDIYLSPGYQRETVTLSVHQAAELPNQDFFSQVEAIFERYQGRPHWGKLHTQTPAQLKAHYPYWPRFQAIRQRLDPDNRFLNPYLRALLLD